MSYTYVLFYYKRLCLMRICRLLNTRKYMNFPKCDSSRPHAVSPFLRTEEDILLKPVYEIMY